MAAFTVDYTTILNQSNVTSSLLSADDGQISTKIKDKIMRGFYVGISSLGVAGNVVVLIVLLSLVKMRKKLTSLFIINQSIVDALTAIFLLLTTVLPPDGNKEYLTVADDLYCRLWVTRFPLWLCIHCSTYNLVALTIERYISVVHPIVHKMAFNRLKAILMVATAWFVSIIHNTAGSMPFVFIADGACQMAKYPSKASMLANGIIGFCLVYFIPICILVFCYSRMAYALKLKVRQTAVSTVSGSVQADGTSRSQTKAGGSMKDRARRNVIKTLMVVSTAFILCNSWNQWFFFLFKLGVFDYRSLSTNFYHFSVIAMFSNCCVNPFIYAAQYEEFQKGLRNVFCRRATSSVEPSSNTYSTSGVGQH